MWPPWDCPPWDSTAGFPARRSKARTKSAFGWRSEPHGAMSSAVSWDGGCGWGRCRSWNRRILRLDAAVLEPALRRLCWCCSACSSPRVCRHGERREPIPRPLFAMNSLKALPVENEARAYLAGREPVMRMPTSRLALCCQSGLVATLATPISARSRSIGSRSLRMSPLFIARFTSARIASQMRA